MLVHRAVFQELSEVSTCISFSGCVHGSVITSLKIIPNFKLWVDVKDSLEIGRISLYIMVG